MGFGDGISEDGMACGWDDGFPGEMRLLGDGLGFHWGMDGCEMVMVIGDGLDWLTGTGWLSAFCLLDTDT